MKERPILFSGPMVRAILDGRKTQTRRVIGGTEEIRWFGWPCGGDRAPAHSERRCSPPIAGSFHYHDRNGFNWGDLVSRFGVPGDRLWVRETFYCDHCFVGDYDLTAGRGTVTAEPDRAECEREWREMLYFRADVPGGRFEDADYWGEPGSFWRPSIHMPRWASRLTLEITEVRVERLQEISEEDARAEGAPVADIATGRALLDPASSQGCHRWGFELLWDSINGKRAPWSSNPWVWVVSFRRVDP